MIVLNERLKAVASLVRKNTVLADIGCDHGFLPVYLLKNNLIKYAVASDINEKPLNACKNLIKREKLEDKVKCVISDGLQNIPSCVEDVSICGMGGELISRIVDECKWAKKPNKHFLFNPMTHSEILREYLCYNGFEIGADFIVKEGKHYYNVFDAYYTGKVKSYDSVYCFLGNIKNFEYKEYFYHLLNYLENKQKGGADYSNVISAIRKKL
ncbi:MAG: class I SAM-dependent methyltransferase [Clostridiales bacterium]|nr:class I SAM-dependent methyltransferase [Clostridiales bacterium]